MCTRILNQNRSLGYFSTSCILCHSTVLTTQLPVLSLETMLKEERSSQVRSKVCPFFQRHQFFFFSCVFCWFPGISSLTIMLTSAYSVCNTMYDGSRNGDTNSDKKLGIICETKKIRTYMFTKQHTEVQNSMISFVIQLIYFVRNMNSNYRESLLSWMTTFWFRFSYFFSGLRLAATKNSTKCQDTKQLCFEKIL